MTALTTPQTEIVVVTSSGQQYLGVEIGDLFYAKSGEVFPSKDIATAIKREYSIYANH